MESRTALLDRFTLYVSCKTFDVIYNKKIPQVFALEGFFIIFIRAFDKSYINSEHDMNDSMVLKNNNAPKIIDQKTIKKRKNVLKKAGEELKKQFVGIDSIIDRIISLMESWYVLPEIITRPVIICLWGTTGVGKTDLIRKLVRAISYYERYVEIQMDDTNSGYSLKSMLLSSDIPEGEPGILLLDEMQRFRTKDEEEKSKNTSGKLNDTWMLLSDGKFIHDFGAKTDAQEYIFDDLYWDDYQKANAEEEDDEKETDKTDEPTSTISEVEEEKKKKKKKQKKYERQFHMSYWSAKRIKRMLRSNETPEEIMKWDSERKLKEIRSYLSSPESIREFDFHKLLIFVCGNLDEAYAMSEDTAETDLDADIMHEFSKDIDFLTIKKSLLKRFYPEQIARFGNLHVIYPTLSRSAYEEIIRLYVEKVTTNVKELTGGINIKVDKTIYDSIYRNGVFPAQGVRPVLTTISGTFECMLPIFIQRAIETGTKEFTISTDGKRLLATINGRTVKSEKINYEIDKIKQKKNKNALLRNAVHEAGHAVAYTLLHKVSPTELKSALASSDGAYTLTHRFSNSKQNIIKKLQVLYGGMIAEELVFGERLRSSGAVHDISQATIEASYYIRMYGFDKDYSGRLEYPTSDAHTNFMADNEIDTSEKINSLLVDAKKEVRKLFEDNIDYLKELSHTLSQKETMTAEEIIVIAKKYIRGVKIVNAGDIIIEDYLTPFNKFVNSSNGSYLKKEVSKK